MVVGARGKGSETKWHRDLANRVFNSLATYVTKFKVRDLTSGFRLVRTATARKFIYLLPDTFSYPSTITMAYLRSGRSLKYVSIQTKARKGKSKIKLARDGVRFLLIITKIATMFSPFRVFLPVSFFVFCGRSALLPLHFHHPAPVHQYVGSAAHNLKKSNSASTLTQMHCWGHCVMVLPKSTITEKAVSISLCLTHLCRDLPCFL